MRQLFPSVLSLILFFSFARPLPAANVDFAKQVLPVFQQHCIGCHGKDKAMGKLRLHTVQDIQAKQAEDDHFLIAGKPNESELYERLVLPAEDKKRMPKKADPLPKEETELIRLWIEQGAVFAVAANVAPQPKPETKKPAARKPLPLPKVESADAAAVEKLTAAGALVGPLFGNSPLLRVSLAMRDEPATDQELALLAGVGSQIYELNLAAAQVSDKGLATLAQLPNLSRLHLEKSSVSDSGLAALAKLARLEYLNLYGTSITDAGLKHLHGLQNLSNLYLWQTKVSYDAAMALEQKIPGLTVNLGFDHPEVVRRRITKELEQAEKQAKEAADAATKLKQEFEAATKTNEAAAKRLEELKKQLEDLNAEKK
jgi:mono/diheme cytochrome c family protein